MCRSRRVKYCRRARRRRRPGHRAVRRAAYSPRYHPDRPEPAWNQSGTLFEGIERWAERKALLTHDDVKTRARQTLKWQIANGIQHVRTHVDVSDATLTALKAMLEVKQEVAPWVDLQIAAFPQEGIMSYPDGEALLEEALRLARCGAILHFEFTREYGVESFAQNLCAGTEIWPPD